MFLNRRTAQSVLLAACLSLPAYVSAQGFGHDDGAGIHHVLLVSIDGMHAVDFINCSTGLAGVNAGKPYCPTLAQLAEHGVSYLDTSTSKPSDSFPGLMAIVTGGSPRTVGAFYDVAYDRSLNPPAITTGNGVAGGTCKGGATPSGTTTEYEEGIDFDQTQLNGVSNSTLGTFGGGIAAINPARLPRDKSCNPVYPWDFVRTNTVFGVVHGSGGYTAWSDKHPAYSSVSGHGSNGKAVDDFYSPEINSTVIAMPGITTPLGMSCAVIPDPNSDVTAYTNSFQNIQCYDTLKVNAVLNWIDGKTHDGKHNAKVPALFGMNFQAVSVGQKLIEKSNGMTGGYQDAIGTPTPALLSEIEFVDASIAEWVAELKKEGLYNQTEIIISAKHGQSPLDSPRYTRITSTGPVTTSPATILDNNGNGCIPASESPSNSSGIGPTEDDVSLIWLNNKCTTSQAVEMLESQSPASNNIAGIGQIFSGSALTQLFNAPGLPPSGDPRTPDIIVTPNVGVTYSGSTKKLAEHGGFAHDDTNVMLLIANPSLHEQTITSPVETEQIAPTVLQILGLNPNSLQAVQIEGTQVLPGVSFTSFPF